MKKKEVPQDNDGLQQGKFRDVCYVVDEDGNYTTELSTGWSPKNEAMKQAWEQVNEKVEEAKQDVISGRKSILSWHMEKNIMAIKLLSQYTGIPRRKIRKHLKPGIFSALDNNMLQKYADAFNISLEELINPNELKGE
jgi:hypothetical protein